MANIDMERFRDKLLGCWAGKNIGGTIGGPFEGKPGPLDIRFYTQELEGKPLPNDDLDLQLIWLAGVEKYYSPYGLTPQIMGDLWHDFILGHWNEYSVCSTNIKHGFFRLFDGF